MGDPFSFVFTFYKREPSWSSFTLFPFWWEGWGCGKCQSVVGVSPASNLMNAGWQAGGGLTGEFWGC